MTVSTTVATVDSYNFDAPQFNAPKSTTVSPKATQPEVQIYKHKETGVITARIHAPACWLAVGDNTINFTKWLQSDKIEFNPNKEYDYRVYPDGSITIFFKAPLRHIYCIATKYPSQSSTEFMARNPLPAAPATTEVPVSSTTPVLVTVPVEVPVVVPVSLPVEPPTTEWTTETVAAQTDAAQELSDRLLSSVDEVVVSKIDYTNTTVKNLRIIARDAGIKNCSKLNKAQLIAALS